ncbi:hypothetical protein C0992_008179 [Termitomyces sp. T32_za158]|nr:hypothetical protein C0992_008179 [Termitomyces sp. T32_za158]
MFSALRACARLPSWTTGVWRSSSTTLFSLSQSRSFHPTPSSWVTINQAMKRKKPQKILKSKSPLLNSAPQRKGVCTQIFTKKPKKPNSSNRRVARVKLSTGKTLQAYIQGEGHNLQEHSVVLIRGGRAQDLPGVGYKVVRGAMDLGGVVGRATARSRYGVKKPKK